MAQVMTNGVSAGEPPQKKSALRGWLSLGLWLAGVWLFIFVLAPMMKELPAVKPLARYIAQSGIDAGAIYYTEVEQVADADLMVRDTLRFYLAAQEDKADKQMATP